MPKADVQELVSVLGSGLVPPLVVEQEYQRLSTELGDQRVLTQAVIVPVQAGVPTYELPADVVRVHDAVFDAVRLSYVALQALDAVGGPRWRTHVGFPRAYTFEGESERTIRLYPAPPRTSAFPIFPLGNPLGDDYPTDALVLLCTQRRAEEPAEGGLPHPTWLDLWMALVILGRAFGREASTQDLLMAGACGQLGQLVEGMVLGEG